MEAPLKLNLRDATEADVPTLTRIDAACFPPEDRYARGLMEDIIRGKFAVDTVDRVSTLLVSTPAGEGERVLGFITVARDKGAGLVVTIDIDPQWRRRGLGRMLIRAGEAKLRGWGVQRVMLTVGSRNGPAQRLYEKEGYAFLERIPHYYESGDDALALVKLI